MKPTWKIFSVYILIIIFMIVFSTAKGQNICKSDVCVVEFNAGWNNNNSVEWLNKLSDCGVKRISIDKGDWAKKYNIVVVPTIIVFKDGEEVKRFQADISFSMKATLEDVQEVVDDSNMDSF